jgi:hypothetical protein
MKRCNSLKRRRSISRLRRWGNETIWLMIIKKQSGLRLSRNDIVRHLIDQATLDSLEGIKRHVKKTTTHPQEQPTNMALKKDFALKPEYTTLRSGYALMTNRKIPTLRSAFLPIARCLNMLPADDMRQKCAALATTQMRICTCFTMPGDR